MYRKFADLFFCKYFRSRDDNPEVIRIAKEGKIILPDKNSIQKRSNIGVILSCGPGCKYKFKPGQTVMIDRWVNETDAAYYYWEDRRVRFLREQDITAVVEGD